MINKLRFRHLLKFRRNYSIYTVARSKRYADKMLSINTVPTPSFGKWSPDPFEISIIVIVIIVGILLWN